MPNLDLPEPPTVEAAAPPPAQLTLVPTERSLHDLFTGGWRRRLTGLPTVLGRPLARWAERGRSALRSAGRRTTEQDAAGK